LCGEITERSGVRDDLVEGAQQRLQVAEAEPGRVDPAEIVSMPSSSQRALASSTASGSLTPHIGPSANTFSYSARVFPSRPTR